MEPHKIWIDQCEAAKQIAAEFDTQRALDYLVGEKLVNFLEAAEDNADFRIEIPGFVAKIHQLFENWPLAQYLEVTRKSEPFDPALFEGDVECDADEVEEMRKEDIRRCGADLLLVERAREWLLEN